eukprot:scaffold26372_cov120-Isochrysis_galbana.AAC.9
MTNRAPHRRTVRGGWEVSGKRPLALPGPPHLLSTHHPDARVWPHEHEARRVSAAAHAVVSRAEGAAHHQRELGHGGGGDGVD